MYNLIPHDAIKNPDNRELWRRTVSVRPTPSANPSSSTSHQPGSSHAFGTGGPIPGPPPPHLLDGIYDNFEQLTKSHFYTDPVTLCLVEDITKETEFHEVLEGDSWMVCMREGELPESVFTAFKKAFPKLVYEVEEDGIAYYWEWVINAIIMLQIQILT